jgi:hypothetical protein
LVRLVYERKKVTKVDRYAQKIDKKKNRIHLTLYTTQWMVRFMDTSLLFIFSLQKYEQIALDRESSHPLENFFGSVRKDSHDVNTPEQMESTIAHTDLVKEAMNILQLDEHVPGRANLAGVRLTDTTQEDESMYNIALGTEIAPERIAMSCLRAAQYPESELSAEDQLAYGEFRQFMLFLQKAADESRINTEIDQRFNVGSASRIINLITGHGARRI